MKWPWRKTAQQRMEKALAKAVCDLPLKDIGTLEIVGWTMQNYWDSGVEVNIQLRGKYRKNELTHMGNDEVA